MDFLFQVCVRNQGHIQARYYAYCKYTLLLGVGSGRPWSEEILPLPLVKCIKNYRHYHPHPH